MFNQNIFRKRLKDLRIAESMSQREMSNNINISRNSIGKLEREGNFVSIKMLCDIADYFDVSADYLLGRSDSKEYNRSKEDERPLEYIDDL